MKNIKRYTALCLIASVVTLHPMQKKSDLPSVVDIFVKGLDLHKKDTAQFTNYAHIHASKLIQDARKSLFYNTVHYNPITKTIDTKSSFADTYEHLLLTNITNQEQQISNFDSIHAQDIALIATISTALHLIYKNDDDQCLLEHSKNKFLYSIPLLLSSQVSKAEDYFSPAKIFGERKALLQKQLRAIIYEQNKK